MEMRMRMRLGEQEISVSLLARGNEPDFIQNSKEEERFFCDDLSQIKGHPPTKHNSPHFRRCINFGSVRRNSQKQRQSGRLRFQLLARLLKAHLAHQFPKNKCFLKGIFGAHPTPISKMGSIFPMFFAWLGIGINFCSIKVNKFFK